MEKVYFKTKEGLMRVFLLLAVWSLGVTAAFAQDGTSADSPVALVDGQEYTLKSFSGFYATYTASEDGVLTLSYSVSNAALALYTDATFSTVDESGAMSWNGSYYPYGMSIEVKTGETYYFGKNFLMDAATLTVSFVSGNPTVTLESSSPADGEVISITANPQLYVTFSMPVSVSSASIAVNGVSVDNLEVVPGRTVVYVVAQQLMAWYADGTMKAGDEVTVTLSGVASTANSSVIYGEDGVCTLKFTAAPEPMQLVGTVNGPSTGMPTLYSYIYSGEGTVELQFDQEVSTTNMPVARLSYGSTDYSLDNAYYEENDIPVSVEGNTVKVDLGGKLRRHVDMLPLYNVTFPTISLKVGNICSADGQPAYSGSNSSVGAFTFDYAYSQRATVAASVEATPLAGAEIKAGDELKLYVFGNSGLRYDGVTFAYNVNGVVRYYVVSQSDITTAVYGTDAELTLAVPNLPAEAGSEVSVSLNNLEALDGADYSAACTSTFSYTSSESTLSIESSTPADGASLEELTSVSLTLADNTGIGVLRLDAWDVTTNEALSVMNTMEQDGLNYSLEFYYPSTLYEGHSYEITISAYANDRDAMQGVNCLGSQVITVAGATKPFEFSTVTLVSVTPEPESEIASAEDNKVVATFSAPVEITAESAFINMGYGMHYDFTSITSNDDKTVWTFEIPSYAMTGTAVSLSVAAYDTEGKLVEGNTGFESNSYFEWTYYTYFNAPDLVITPNGEEAVTSLYEFSITVDGGDPIAETYTSGQKIELRNLFGEVLATGSCEMVIPEDKLDDYSYMPVEMKVTLSEEITDAGSYVLYIPSGYFNLGSEMSAQFNKATFVRYTIEATGEAAELIPSEVTPADGSKVNEISAVTLTCDCEYISQLVWEDYGSYVSLANKQTGDVVGGEVSVEVVMDDATQWYTNQITISFAEPVTDAGTYVLTIQPNLFSDEMYDPYNPSWGGAVNPELTYEFSISGDGVSAVVAEAGKVTVYTLGGVKVLDNAEADALKTLKKGIYIVNGKKVVVK